MQQGLFITLEGIEGAGKSTFMPSVAEIFTEAGNDEVIQTREPGGTKTGEQIRSVLLDSKNVRITDDTELLLMFAARVQHINEIINPALTAGKIVLCDRFTDASYAYQGGGRGIESSRIQVLENWVQQGLKPNLTLLFDLAVETGLRRAGRRQIALFGNECTEETDLRRAGKSQTDLFGDVDRFEHEKISFFEKIRSCYLQRAKNEPKRFRVIDSSQSFDNVKLQIQDILKEFLC